MEGIGRMAEMGWLCLQCVAQLSSCMCEKYVHSIKSVLGRVGNLCNMLVCCLCYEMVVSQHIVDTRLMLYKYVMIL